MHVCLKSNDHRICIFSLVFLFSFCIFKVLSHQLTMLPCKRGFEKKRSQSKKGFTEQFEKLVLILEFFGYALGRAWPSKSRSESREYFAFWPSSDAFDDAFLLHKRAQKHLLLAWDAGRDSIPGTLCMHKSRSNRLEAQLFICSIPDYYQAALLGIPFLFGKLTIGN